MQMRLGTLSFAFALAFALGAGDAMAQSSAERPMAPAARAHLDRGVTAYDAGRYEEAITEFRAAYDIDPKRELLFAWAQAERLSGDCPSAVTLYRRFLATDPPPAEGNKAALQLAKCEQALATQPPVRTDALPPPAPTVASTAPPPPARDIAPPPAAAPPRAPTPWYTDAFGDVLTAGGVAGIGIGVGFLLAAQASASAASSASTYGQFRHDGSDAKGRTLVGAIALGAGAALVAIGIIRYASRSRTAPPVARAARAGRGILVGSGF